MPAVENRKLQRQSRCFKFERVHFGSEYDVKLNRRGIQRLSEEFFPLYQHVFVLSIYAKKKYPPTVSGISADEKYVCTLWCVVSSGSYYVQTKCCHFSFTVGKACSC